VCGGQASPHKPRLVVSHSTCPPLSSSFHAHSFVLGTAVINTHTVKCHRNAINQSRMPSQRNQSESFRFKRAAFYQGLKSKVGLAVAKAAALRINLNVQGCSVVADPMHAPSRERERGEEGKFPSSPPPPFTQSPSPPRSLVRDGQPSPYRPRLVVSRSTCPPISPTPHVNSFVLGPAVINTHSHGTPK
jgi:hypothetical protein